MRILVLIPYIFICSFFFSLEMALHAASFQGLGDPSKEIFRSFARAVSADGSIVVGFCNGTNGKRAFRWTQYGGIEILGTLPTPGDPFLANSEAHDISSDGNVIVGGSSSSNGYVEAFRWTAATGMVGLGDLPGGVFRSEALGVSADGSVIIGDSLDADSHEAFKWRDSSGMNSFIFSPKGEDSWATGISNDGSTIVGYPDFRWRETEGLVRLRDLVSGFSLININAVSANGLAIVGSSHSKYGFLMEAFRWTLENGMQGLGHLPGTLFIFSMSEAKAVSADGTRIVGSSSTLSESLNFSAKSGHVFLWSENSGMIDLKNYLTALGINLSDWVLLEATGISADGTVIVGTGINPAGESEAWRAVIPKSLPSKVLPWKPVFGILFGCGLIAVWVWMRLKKKTNREITT